MVDIHRRGKQNPEASLIFQTSLNQSNPLCWVKIVASQKIYVKTLWLKVIVLQKAYIKAAQPTAREVVSSGPR